MASPELALSRDASAADPAPRVFRPAATVKATCALLALAIGSSVLCAWWLRPLLGIDASFLWLMKANTAFGVACCAVGMLLLGHEGRRATWLRRLLGGVVFALALATVVEYATGAELGIDQLLVTDPSASFPGRMSPWTAATFLFLATALIAHRASQFDWQTDGALLGAGATLQIIVAGYLYGVTEFYALDPLTRVSPQTLVCLAALWIALIAARLGTGILAIATRPTPGGTAVRLLLPAAVLLPPLLGWVRLLAEWQGLVSPVRGVALFAAAQTMILGAVIYGFALRLDAFELRYRAERRRRAELERMVAICAWTGRVRWNGEWVRVEQYLHERWGVRVTHTISDEAMQRMEEEIAATERAGAGKGPSPPTPRTHSS